MLLRSLLILLACLSLAFAATPAQALQVQLAWDAPLQANGTPVPNLAGYKLHYGSQSGQYKSMISVGMTTTYTVTNLSAGQTYYFAATAYDANGTESAFSNEVSVTLPTSPPTNPSGGGLIPQQQMQVVSVDSQERVGENGAATNALDGNPATLWHTEWSQRTAPLPHTLVLNLGGRYQVDGIRYLPRQDGSPNGTIASYQVYVSDDGTTWGSAVAAGPLAADTSEKTVRFTAKTGRFMRLVASAEINGQPWTSAAELNVFGTLGTSPSVTLSAAPGSIAAGQTATLTWAATNATACSAAWTASTATAGSQTVKPTSTTTYTMTCTNASASASASTSVTVTAPPKPSVTLSAAPGSIAAGQTATLTWAATNATACSAAWTASTATAGSQTVKPTSTTTYTMTCTGAGGSASASTSVTVTAPPKPSVTLSAAPGSIAAGQTATLTWAATNATACSAAWTASTATAGSQTVKPTSTTTYTMTCTNASASASASTSVTVTTPPKPSVTLSAAPGSIAAGQTATLTWAATNATACSAAWTASTATAGSQTVKPTSTTTYTMTCTNASTSASASTTVSINTSVGNLIPQRQMQVVSVDSQERVGENGAATNALDGNPATLWHTEWSQRTAPLPHTLVLNLGGRYQVDGIRYLPRQDGSPNGTIASYQVYVSDDGTTWGSAVAAGTLAADTSEKTVRFTAKTGRFMRLVASAEINGQPWTSAAELNVFGTAVVSPPANSLIPQQQMQVVSVDSQERVGENGAATNALDGNPATLWHTEWSQRTAPLPHTLVLNLGGQYQVDGIRYLPRQDGSPNGTITSYQVYVSDDGTTWGSAVAAGTLAADTSEKTVRFTAKTGRFMRLVASAEINGQPWTSAAELNVFGTAAPSSTTATSSLLTQSVATSPATSSTATSTTTASKSTIATTPTSASQSMTQTATARVSSVTSASSTPTTTTPTTAAYQNIRWEMTLTSTKTYANPFTDVTVAVEYTKAGSPPLQGYGFWDGGATFKLRQAFPEPGTWHYKTTATDLSNSGLHNREGDVSVLPYTGTNPLYRHGFLQVSADRRFLAHADGTPFLWVGDTLWGATVWLTEAGFHEAIADRRAKHLTVLQTNFARKDEVDTAGDTPWEGDRWNVRFMQKLDRMFNDANDQGMYLFVNGLVDLFWDRGITPYDRLVEMIGARYAAHYVSFASSMDDAYDPIHAQINTAIRRTAPQHLLTQHPGDSDNGQGNVWTAEQYYDTPSVDYVMAATGVEGNLELACHNAIEWSLRLYNHVPPKPVVNGETWYEGLSGGTAEIAAVHLGYLSLLSGNSGYTYGSSLWDATDDDLPTWKALRGATYLQYLYDFFVTLDEGRPLQPRHALIKNQATRYQDRMVLGVSTDGMTYAAFLPHGATIDIDLTALAGTTVGVTWYNPLTGQYRDQGTVPGGAVRSFTSPFEGSPAALVLMAQ